MRFHGLPLTCLTLVGLGLLACSSNNNSSTNSTSSSASTGTSSGGSGTAAGGSGTGTSSGGAGTGTSTGGASTTGTSTGGAGTGTSTGGSTSSTGGNLPTWTAIPLMDDPTDGSYTVQHSGQSLVTGIHFDDLTHGAVTLHGDQGTFVDGGAIESLNSATTINKVAFSGYNACILDQSCDFIEFTTTPLGLLAYNTFGDTMYTSTDKGVTWTTTQTSIDHTPNADQVFMGPDSSGKWHELDAIGNVWITNAAPSPSASWTRTWQPENNTYGGMDPNDTPLPDTECAYHFADQPFGGQDYQQVFWMSADGQTMLYPDTNSQGVCRSTDGGLNFFPVEFPAAPASSFDRGPYAVLFTSATHGVVGYANTNDDAAAYAYYTDDAGATWQAATLPSTVAGKNGIQIAGAFASPSGKVSIVGWQEPNSDVLPLLLVSSDNGHTFKDISASLVQTIGTSGLDTAKLHAGFALDDNNIWVGGDWGGFLYSPSGGE